MSKPNNDSRRYTLEFPIELFLEIKCIATENGATEIEVLRKFIKLGLLATSGKCQLYIKKDDGEFAELAIFDAPPAVTP